jgi:hypothetical protein
MRASRSNAPIDRSRAVADQINRWGPVGAVTSDEPEARTSGAPLT